MTPHESLLITGLDVAEKKRHYIIRDYKFYRNSSPLAASVLEEKAGIRVVKNPFQRRSQCPLTGSTGFLDRVDPN